MRFPGLFRLCLYGSLMGVLLLATCGCSDSGGRGGNTDSLAPDFALESSAGGTLQLDDYRGQVVMLHFWATWCAPCRAAIAHEIKFQEKYAKRGFTVLGMNMDTDRKDVFKFLERNELNYPTLFLDEETRAAYGGVSNIPLTIIIDRNGQIRRKSMGYTLQLITSLEQTIEMLLEEDSVLPYGS